MALTLNSTNSKNVDYFTFQKFLLHGYETSAILYVKNQKVVLKVLRVDFEKGHIDLSLRRVTKRERIEKIMSWKKERKSEALCVKLQ